MIAIRASLAAACLFCAWPALAQPFGTGPGGMPVGSSMAGAPLYGAPARPAPAVPGARVFGDTAEERAWLRRGGRPYDDSHLRPDLPRAKDAPSIQERALQGRSRLDAGRAGVYARSGPAAIGGSAITRPALQAPRRAPR